MKYVGELGKSSLKRTSSSLFEPKVRSNIDGLLPSDSVFPQRHYSLGSNLQNSISENFKGNAIRDIKWVKRTERSVEGNSFGRQSYLGNKPSRMDSGFFGWHLENSLRHLGTMVKMYRQETHEKKENRGKTQEKKGC